MKLLTIVRHGKSLWGNFELSDHDRPLKDTGIKRTKKIINFLNQRDFKPELLLSSDAIRAFQTATMIAEGIGYPVEKIQKSSTLYHASTSNIYSELFAIDNDIDSVMIFGHNPGFTDFVNDFVHPKIDNLPTTGTVCIEFKTNKWENIVDAEYDVKFAVYPRMLP